MVTIPATSMLDRLNAMRHFRRQSSGRFDLDHAVSHPLGMAFTAATAAEVSRFRAASQDIVQAKWFSFTFFGRQTFWTGMGRMVAFPAQRFCARHRWLCKRKRGQGYSCHCCPHHALNPSRRFLEPGLWPRKWR
jgi:hypothetical protein